MSLGKNIKTARESQHITQANLAAESGLSRSYLADVERDRYNPSVETLMKIANALHTEAGSLMQGMVSDRPDGGEPFDRWEFRGLISDEIEALAAIAAIFKKTRRGR